MSDPVIPRDLSARMRVLQLIWYALTGMSAVLLCVFWYLRAEANIVPQIEAAAGIPLAMILAGVGLLVAVLSFVLPDLIATQAHPGYITFETYQMARLIQGALLEAAALLQGAGFLLEGEWWSLLVGGTIVLLMAGSVPTRDTATRWLTRHKPDHSHGHGHGHGSRGH